MPSPSAARRAAASPGIQPILSAVGKAGTPERAFAAAFYQRMTPEEAGHHPAAVWAAIATDAMAFAGTRKRGTPMVRVFNPDAAKHGWSSPRSVLQVVNDDMPFLVDSVTNALTERGIGVHGLGHPVMKVTRDRAGRMQAVGEGQVESFIHVEIDRRSAAEARALEADLRQVLADVRASVDDWRAIRDRMLEAADALPTQAGPVEAAVLEEAAEFLRWAADDHFTFLGYREYSVERQGKDEMLVAVEGSGLGLMREADSKPRLLKSIEAHAVQKLSLIHI